VGARRRAGGHCTALQEMAPSLRGPRQDRGVGEGAALGDLSQGMRGRIPEAGYKRQGTRGKVLELRHERRATSGY
jgi:hypothetical protein